MRVVALFLAAPLLVACGSSHPSSRPTSQTIAPAGGCGASTLRNGTLPAWTASAGVPASGPYAITEHRNAVGIMGPLRAGHPRNPANKILWIVRLPRDGSDLVIRARPLSASKPVVTIRFPPDSSPGEIYPSSVDVPKAGCWRLTLRWAGHTDSLELPYLTPSPLG